MEKKLKYEKPGLIRLSRFKDKLGGGQNCINGSGNVGACTTGDSATLDCGTGNSAGQGCLPGNGPFA